MGGEGGMGVATLSVPFCTLRGSRYLEAEGRGEQVHGNSEIIAYACEPDI